MRKASCGLCLDTAGSLGENVLANVIAMWLARQIPGRD